MRLLLITFFSFTSLFGFMDTINSLSTDFEQQITDDQNATIIYKGHMQAKRPNMAFWDYKTPVEKQLFIREHQVVILEPELEQAIIKNVSSDVDIFTIISKATLIMDDTYLAYYRDMEFIIKVNGNVIQSISYEDAFENSIVLTFSNQHINATIEDDAFKALIPADFDILRE